MQDRDDAKCQQHYENIYRLVRMWDAPKFSKVFDMFPTPPDIHADCLLEIGKALYHESYIEYAITIWSLALKLMEDESDEKLLCYFYLGIAHYNLGDHLKTTEYSSKIIDFARKGNTPKVIEHTSKIIDFAMKGNSLTLQLTYLYLGSILFELQQYRRTVELYQSILQKNLPVKVQAAYYIQIAKSFEALSEYKEQLEYFEKALAILDTNESSTIAACHHGIGNAHLHLGQYYKARESYEKCLEIGDLQSSGHSYASLAIYYAQIGDHQKEIELLKKALPILIENGGAEYVAHCLNILCAAYFSIGDHKEAEKYVSEALKIARSEKTKLACYQNMAMIQINQGRYDEAISSCRNSIELATAIDAKSELATCYLNQGIAYVHSNKKSQAIECIKKSLEISLHIEDVTMINSSLLNLGKILLNEEPKIAYYFLKLSIELTEATGSNIVDHEHQIDFYGNKLDAYYLIVPLCLSLDEKREAFEYVERSKAKAFLSMMSNNESSRESELESRFNVDKNILGGIINIIKRELVLLDKGGKLHNKEELSRIIFAINEFRKQYVSDHRMLNMTLDEIQKTITKTVLLEYFVTSAETIIFVITSQSIEVRRANISRNNIIQYVRYYMQDFIKSKKTNVTTFRWSELSKHLIEPVSKYLMSSEMVYFVPHDVLHYFPLHILEIDKRPIIMKHPIAYLPSASTLQFVKNNGSGKMETCSSFGAVFNEEAEEVAELFNVKAITDASKDTALNELREEKDILHFSCHGFFQKNDPLISGIIFHSQDGRIDLNRDILTAREIFDLKLNAELVTLSACETGMNDAKPGDEVVGLTRSLLYAGAASVLVSLWSADARATNYLMIEFYKQLRGENEEQRPASKAIALQRAMIETMQNRHNRKWKHPRYWAPFVLIGA